MSLTLLLDLDDTLLENDIEAFLLHYLGAFAREVAPIVDSNKFVKTLLAGTQEMVKNRQPDRTLKETFDAAFFPALGVEASQFQDVSDRFYADVFPTLRGLTRPIPEAKRLVEEVTARGYRMAIATNPLFPLTAVLQRLDWANLPAEKYPFEVIASYETFHFTKPDPAYFVEVLGRMGWPSSGVVVVGDDIQREIIAGRNLGLSTFWIAQQGITPPDGPEAPNKSGELGDVLPWLDSTPEEDLHPKYDTPIAMVAILRATPAVLDSFCRGLPAEVWSVQPRENEWSITEILCHLRDVENDVNLPRMRKVLGEFNPFLPGEDTDPWARERNYILQDGKEALQQFVTARIEMLDLLEGMLPDDWQRPARHAIFGPTSLTELVNIIAGHDRLHVQQVYEVLGIFAP